jgi:hypothetical protein
MGGRVKNKGNGGSRPLCATMKYQGNIYWDGKTPRIQSKEKFIEWLSQFPEDQWFSMEITPIGTLNNTSQSKLYHKWTDIMAEEFGWDSGTEMHQFLKDKYNDGKSTKGFSTKEWSEYMIKVQAFAHSNNITLPTGTS